MDDDLHEKKPNYAAFIPLFIIAVYLGLCLGGVEWGEVSLDNFQYIILKALIPTHIRITSLTINTVAICLLVWLIGFMYYIGNFRKYMTGKEYGSGRIAQPYELNKVLEDKNNPTMNKIVSENIRVSMDTRKTGLNNNALVIGGSGAGKTFYLVKPNVYNCGQCSYVFCDPKGELLRDTGKYLETYGYTIKVLNLVDMDSSDGYNPFEYIRSDEDVTKLITNLIQNTTPKGSNSSDPFWEKGESMLLQALFLYVWYEYPKQGKPASFRGVLELLNQAKVNGAAGSGSKEDSALDAIMNELPPDHPALVTYKKINVGAADTIRSLIISANARLAYLQNSKILHILDRDDMDIRSLGEGIRKIPDKKTALYCVIPDNDKSYSFIVGMLYTQIFQELYYVADHDYDGRLPVHVAFWMDEFANCALPDSFTEILATCRSREISCNIIIQNLAQLKTLFKDAWENISGNCDTLIYLGGNEQSTHEYMSKMLGKATIDKRTSGETLGGHGSSSRNFDVLGRDILDPSEVRKIDNNKCLVLIKGFDPVIDYKYKTQEKAVYDESNRIGSYVHGKDQDLDDGRDIFYMNYNGDPMDSVYYQVKQYKGIFEGTTGFRHPVDIPGGYFILADNLGAYKIGNSYFSPVFSKGTMVCKTGLGELSKHSLTGFRDIITGEIIDKNSDLVAEDKFAFERYPTAYNDPSKFEQDKHRLEQRKNLQNNQS